MFEVELNQYVPIARRKSLFYMKKIFCFVFGILALENIFWVINNKFESTLGRDRAKIFSDISE